MWEYLSCYAERQDMQERFVVSNFPQIGDHVLEVELLDRLGAEGWELVAVVPAYARTGGRVNHQLYFKRPRGTPPTDRPTTRLPG